MAHERETKIYSASIVPPDESFLTQLSIPQRIQNALTPGSSAESYGRTWRIGQTELKGNLLIGRIGFQGEPGTTEVWNEQVVDFEEVDVPAGGTSPFIVNLETQQVWLQPRQRMTPGGLFRALERLLSLNGEKWTLSPEKPKVDLWEWKQSVSKVTQVKFIFKKPNPHYRETPNLEALLEESDAELAKLELASQEGLDTEASFISETQRHIDAGYGEGQYTGEKIDPNGEVVISRYFTNVGTEEDGRTVRVAEDGEADIDAMAQVASGQNGRQPDDHFY